jgi:hypothetical protein
LAKIVDVGSFLELIIEEISSFEILPSFFVAQHLGSIVASTSPRPKLTHPGLNTTPQ